MTFEEAKQQAVERSEWVLCHIPDPGWPRHHWKGRKRGFRRRGVVRVHKATESIEVYWGSLRSRIRILPPRDPPGDGGRREGGGQVFTGTQLHTL